MSCHVCLQQICVFHCFTIISENEQKNVYLGHRQLKKIIGGATLTAIYCLIAGA